MWANPVDLRGEFSHIACCFEVIEMLNCDYENFKKIYACQQLSPCFHLEQGYTWNW